MSEVPPAQPHQTLARSPAQGRVVEVFGAFLKLGLTAFGGPLAHVGYFRREFVERRAWLDEADFAHLFALCQFLPGPASSQLGFCIGLWRAGWGGAIAAFVAFTAPSALLMFTLATQSARLASPCGLDLLHGLKLVAVAVIAHGLLGMARALASERTRALIAALAAATVTLCPGGWVQLLVVAASALLALFVCQGAAAPDLGSAPLHYGRRAGGVLLCVFALLLGAALMLASRLPPLLRAAAAFYQTGALVFGGGHVVLPLLKDRIVDAGWVSADTFLSAYGAAQAMPGPMFSLAAFLGERLNQGAGGLAGAGVSLIALFLPGLLLVAAALPFWRVIAHGKRAQRAMAGVNAAVVGLLAAALYQPVWSAAVLDARDFAVVVVAFAFLAAARLSALWVVLWCVLASSALHLIA